MVVLFGGSVTMFLDFNLRRPQCLPASGPKRLGIFAIGHHFDFDHFFAVRVFYLLGATEILSGAVVALCAPMSKAV